MQFKPVPPAPDSVELLETVRGAVPRDPEDTDDCCARLVDRTVVESRDAAAEWLTFLRALELATEQAAGFAHTQRDPDRDDFRRAFRDRVYGVDELLARLEEADEPLSATAAATGLGEAGGRGERRDFSSRLAERRKERIERLLEWAVLLELVERTDGGYRRE